jgi:hypothetical protein
MKNSLIPIGKEVKRLQAEKQKLAEINEEMLDMLEEAFKITDKLQMPTEFEISQLRNKLFHLIKKATEL